MFHQANDVDSKGDKGRLHYDQSDWHRVLWQGSTGQKEGQRPAIRYEGPQKEAHRLKEAGQEHLG